MKTTIEWTGKLAIMVAMVAALFLGIASGAKAENNSPQHRMTQDVEFCEDAGGTADYVQIEGYTMSKCVLDGGGGWICDHTGEASECDTYLDGELAHPAGQPVNTGGTRGGAKVPVATSGRVVQTTVADEQ